MEARTDAPALVREAAGPPLIAVPIRPVPPVPPQLSAPRASVAVTRVPHPEAAASRLSVVAAACALASRGSPRPPAGRAEAPRLVGEAVVVGPVADLAERGSAVGRAAGPSPVPRAAARAGPRPTPKVAVGRGADVVAAVVGGGRQARPRPSWDPTAHPGARRGADPVERPVVVAVADAVEGPVRPLRVREAVAASTGLVVMRTAAVAPAAEA